MRRFYAPKDSFVGSGVVLGAEETHHLRDVLRLHVGDDIAVFDGEGREFLARVDELGKNSARLTVADEIKPASPESPCEITLAAALLKNDKLETVIQKAVELGVIRFIPLATARSEVRSDTAEKRLVRWRRIALDAAKQCGRARLMVVEDPLPFGTFLRSHEEQGLKLLFAERAGESLDFPGSQNKLTAVIGPAGGWEDAELETARESGYSIITIGGRILRADTAAISITAILQHRYGDIS